MSVSWKGTAHDREHERVAETLRQHARKLQALSLTPEERRAIEAAAAKLVADDAITSNRLRRAPIWRDRRAMATLAVQAFVAVIASLALLHSIVPGLP